ncbi:RNA polymerase II transcription mediator complex subunit 9-domain-containing protein [Nemania sp. NC0429]|nr:RNA polymerase II transcription mediator complex subunit 9-domain-containing protein [Nemania sp. NC0429]
MSQQQQLPAQVTPLPLPESLNPDALDVLSELAHLLTRLRALPTTTTTSTSTTTAQATTTAAAAPTHTHPHTAPQSQPQSTAHATPTPTALLATRRAGAAELTLKEIPLATDALKHRFQRARALLETALPDVGRGPADQTVEVAALEARIARQRDTLGRLREVGARLAIGEREADDDDDGEKMEE